MLTAHDVLKDIAQPADEPTSLQGIVARIDWLQSQLDEIDDEHARRRAPLANEIDNLTARRAEQTAGIAGGTDLDDMQHYPDDDNAAG